MTSMICVINCKKASVKKTRLEIYLTYHSEVTVDSTAATPEPYDWQFDCGPLHETSLYVPSEHYKELMTKYNIKVNYEIYVNVIDR